MRTTSQLYVDQWRLIVFRLSQPRATLARRTISRYIANPRLPQSTITMMVILAAHIVGHIRRSQVVRKQAEPCVAEAGNGMEHGVPPERVPLQPRYVPPGKIKGYGSQCLHPERDGNDVLDEPVHLGDALFIQQVADGHLGTQAQALPTIRETK